MLWDISTDSQLALFQGVRLEPVQTGRAQKTPEASQEGEEEGDGSEPLRWRHQTPGQHHQRIRHPRSQTLRQVPVSTLPEKLTNEKALNDHIIFFFSANTLRRLSLGDPSQSRLQLLCYHRLPNRAVSGPLDR